jgi:hypothetical protein
MKKQWKKSERRGILALLFLSMTENQLERRKIHQKVSKMEGEHTGFTLNQERKRGQELEAKIFRTKEIRKKAVLLRK